MDGLGEIWSQKYYNRSFGEPGIPLRSWINLVHIMLLLGKKYGLASSQQDMNNHDGKKRVNGNAVSGRSVGQEYC